MGDIDNKANELEKAIMETEYAPVDLPKMNFSDRDYSELPVPEIAALGAAFTPLINTFNSVRTTVGGGEPLLRLVNGSIDELFKLKDGSGLVRGFVHNGSEFTKNGIFEVVQDTAKEVTTTVPYNPAMLFMAIALVHVDKKLSNIEETQKKILNRFETVDRAELQGDLNLLYEILDGYKYWWNNDKIKTENLGIVKHIKKDTTAKIAQYEMILGDEIIKDRLIHFNKDLDRAFNEIYRKFAHYQVAIYEYAFSSFLEVMLSDFFDEKYLSNVTKWISDYNYKYKQTYTKCYDILAPYAGKAVEAVALDGLGKASRIFGETIGKLPFADKITIDEGLVSLGDKIDALAERKSTETLKAFTEMKDSNVAGFIEQIETLNKMHNKPVEILYYNNRLLVAGA